ncbi:type II toxin-antitoxin system RelE/ParE family toxin [Buttiauxella sp. 3AFRM03]|uniref:type II toxin-antitoxin system RelE family toxin n=1 Tax=Buttiauxella sp. 3AFRM03 TaxID=2479367 RepID=UPI000EF785A5|nr:type II toxin-antitoxin system RelE/ParE family toxin [Buttiauxella sp. 3AFRM03]AYN29881.1 type II toxin-antitoxin system RelE/ParE family toxin [Buttiauxella sp. 3AFRM03]
MPKVIWTRYALRQRDKIDSRYQKAISEKVNELKNWPDVHLDSTKLKGSDSHFRVRVGKYRIIFEVQKGEPVVIEIQEVLRRTDQTYSKH